MIFYGGSKENDYDGLSEIGDLSSLKEINLKLENPQNDDNNNITLDKLEKLDFKSLFYSQPSQREKKENFFSYENVNINNINDNNNNINVLNNNKKFVGNKRERDINVVKNEKELEKDIPFEIKNLFMRMQKNPINIDIFEKYKNFKKFNSNEYSKIN